METKQPKWKRVGTIGDINFVEYDGGIVFVDETGVYCPELEYVQNVLDSRKVVMYNVEHGDHNDTTQSSRNKEVSLPQRFAIRQQIVQGEGPQLTQSNTGGNTNDSYN